MWKIIRYVVVFIAVLVAVVPFLWLFLTGLKTNPEIFTNPWLPSEAPQWSNYIEAWKMGNFSKYMLNSFLVGISVITIVVVCSSLSGYAFARLNFLGRDILFYIFLAGMAIPGYLALVPLFTTLRSFGLLDTYLALILPYSAFQLPLAIFLMRGAFRQLPTELADAAKVDGCGNFQIFSRIFLPLCKPTLATVAILTFLWSWKEFLFALVFLRDRNLATVPLGLMVFRGEFLTKWNLYAAGLFVMNIPILVIYFIFQKQFIEGLTAGATKG